jgi:hypothetical protein
LEKVRTFYQENPDADFWKNTLGWGGNFYAVGSPSATPLGRFPQTLFPSRPVLARLLKNFLAKPASRRAKIHWWG